MNRISPVTSVSTCLTPCLQIKSFSVVRLGLEVDPLRFNRWVRILATLDRETNGTLYRCKAVLAQAGSTRKLVFHAVADVVEQVSLEGRGLPSWVTLCSHHETHPSTVKEFLLPRAAKAILVKGVKIFL